MPSDRSETRTCLGCDYTGTDVGLTSSGPRCLGCFMYGDKKDKKPPTPAPRETPTDGDVLMPKDVLGAGEFRDAFKKAVPPRGADTASWVNGYCAGWTACEAALRGKGE